MNTETKEQMLGELYSDWAECQRCGLCDPKHRTRQNVVFGEGNPNANVLIIGDVPGEHDDLTGHPFSNHPVFKMYMESCSATRDDVFVTNIIGCRPTEDDKPNKNRKPTKEEIAACLPRVHRLVEIVDPYIVLLLGTTALKALVKTRYGIKKIAQNEFVPQLTAVTQGVCAPVDRAAFATFHPSYLLRNWSTDEGSDAHLSWGAWRKAFQVADQFNYIYKGIEPPVRGENG